MSEPLTEKLPVIWRGIRYGTATVVKDGLRLRLIAECQVFTDTVARAYLYNDGEPEKRLYIGVLVPEGGLLRARRTVTQSEVESLGFDIKKLGCCGISLTESAEIRPSGGWEICKNPSSLFSDRALKASLSGEGGALTKESGGFMLVALPFDEKKAFPAAPAFVLADIVRISGARYAVLAAGQDGNPLLFNKARLGFKY